MKKIVVILLTVAIVITMYMAFSSKSGPCEELSVYFNSPLDYDSPSEKSDSDIGKALVDLIRNSNETIDFAIYGMRNQNDIFVALMEAKERGVYIRGVVDMDVYNDSYYDNTYDLISEFPDIETDYERDIKTLEENDGFSMEPFWPVPEGFDGPPQCVGYSLKGNMAVIAVHASREPINFEGDIMHNKFFVMDGEKVWTGSTNISDTGTGGYNANIACVVESETIAEWYTREFEQMYEDGKFHSDKISLQENNPMEVKLDKNTEVSCYFSPQDEAAMRGVLPLIQNAKESINVSVFYLTHKEITAELIKAHNRGVDVRIIIDSTSATNGYTKHELLRVAGIPVKVENWGGKMHMKAAAFDDEYLVVGSMNWTSAGENTNDENTLIIHNAYYAKQMNQFFEEIWLSIPDEFLERNPAPESVESIHSLEDGIDNDFDNLIDDMDESRPVMDPLPPYKVVPKEDGHSLIKGVVNKNGFKIYVLPNDKYYDGYKVNESNEGWFPSIAEAKEAGFEKFNYNKHILGK